MCVGYCTTRLEQRISAALAPGEWQEIARLAADTNLTGLPPVIGCPDCADGGAESLTIVESGESRSVSFEYGAAIEQAQPLLDRVRALRTKMTPE
jgi:hypothetical protein